MTSGSETRERFRNLTVRLTLVERAIIDSHAERAGLSLSSYVRQTLLGGPVPRQVRRPPVERAELARLLGELGKIGSNLNQLAKQTNQGVMVWHNEVLVVLAGVKVVCNAILKALGRVP